MSRSAILSALLLSGVSLVAAGPAGSQSPAPAGNSQRARTLRTDALPPGMNGERLTVTLVAVHYGPGEASPPHTHACPVVVYVLAGSIRSQVKGHTEAIYNQGDSFYEAPGRLHMISANANRDVPAQFLAFFVCDHDAPLSSETAPGSSGEKP